MKKLFIAVLLFTSVFTATTYSQQTNDLEQNILSIPSSEYDEAINFLVKGHSVFLTELVSPYADDSGISLLSDLTEDINLYSQLSTIEKSYYTLFQSNKTEMMQSWSNKSYNKTFRVSIDKGLSLNDAAKSALSKLNLGYTIGRAKTALENFDDPSFFWLSSSKLKIKSYTSQQNYSSDNGYIDITVKLFADDEYPFIDCYSNSDKVKYDYTAMMNVIDNIISDIPENASDFQTIAYFNDWLCANNSYNPNNLNSPSDTDSDSVVYADKRAWLPVSALVYGNGNDTTKYPVCEGFAEALKLLCDRVGIACQCRTSATHKWNVVVLEGENYYIDCTWNCGKNGYNKYKYFLIDYSTMSKLDLSDNHNTADKSFGYSFISVTDSIPYLEKQGFTSYSSLDINGDYNIRLNDAALRLKDLTSEKQTVKKDCNGDNKIDIIDVIDTIKLLQK